MYYIPGCVLVVTSSLHPLSAANLPDKHVICVPTSGVICDVIVVTSCVHHSLWGKHATY